MHFCSPRAGLRELVEAVGSLCDFEKFDEAPIQSRSCTELDVNTADRDIIHQLLHLGLMACRRQTCVMCIRRIPAHSFFSVSEYQQAAQCQGSQMDFLIHLFAGSSFNPRV